MKKQEELSNKESCFNKALDDEMMFIILARDPSAIAAIHAWCDDRIKRGLNKVDDLQITKAINCSAYIASTQADIRRKVIYLKREWSVDCEGGTK